MYIYSILLIRLKSPLCFCFFNLNESNSMKLGYKNSFSSTGQRPVDLMRYPFVRRPAVRLSARLSVNNILFLYLLCN